MDGELIKLALRYWPRPIGLVFGLLVTLAGHAVIATTTDISGRWAIGLLLALLCGTVFLWALNRRLPRAVSGKIGVAVAIHCEEQQLSQIREDFVTKLQQELAGSRAAEFQFLDVPSERSDIKTNEDASELLRKCRASFVLAGRAKRRETQSGESLEFIELFGLVRHAPVEVGRKQLLEKEFAEFLPRRLQFKTQGAVFAFEFTAEWAGVVAKYIVGIAAGLSGDLVLSEQLFREVGGHPAVRVRNFFLYRRLRERIPQHLRSLYFARAHREIEGWNTDHDSARMRRLSNILDEARKNGWIEYFRIPECIYEYVTTGNAMRALKILQRIQREQQDAIWELNRAFLLACEGKLRRARAAYEKAITKGIPQAQTDVTVGQVEGFIDWKAQQEPRRPELWFCLAIVNWRLKGDLVQARRDFDRFVATCSPGQYAREVDELRAALFRDDAGFAGDQ